MDIETFMIMSNLIRGVWSIYTKHPKVFQQPEFTRRPFKASIILVKSQNYIIKCLKISSNVTRVVCHVISGHVRSIACEVAHVSPPCATGGTIGDLLISQLKIVITVRKEVPRVIPLCRIQI